MRTIAALLMLLPVAALGQGYDDPRVTDYAANLAMIARV